jgi:carbon dioxide concentrating mechanism protein CcmN
MHLPPLEPPVQAGYFASGDVAIAPDAIIGAGTVLVAEPGSRLEIKSGACLGLGCVLRARGGLLRVDQGAILGAGVLVVGVSLIGSHACIGPSCTLYNSSIQPGQILAPGSLIGQSVAAVRGTGHPSRSGRSTQPSDPTQKPKSVTRLEEDAPSQQPPQPAGGTLATPQRVIGLEQFYRIRQAMFPTDSP